MLMPSNNTSGIVHYFAGKYPGKIGLLMSPDGWRNPPYYMPYALDNGCFIKWEPDKFMNMLFKASHFHKPLWVVVPDVVGNAKETMKRWHEWSPKISEFGYNLAFACQDGMKPQNVPDNAFCCFIGGTSKWKRSNADMFQGIRPWLHIARINDWKSIQWAKWCGADSIDGTGFFRAKNYQNYDFISYFEGQRKEQLQLFN